MGRECGCSSGIREMESRVWMDEFLMFKITFFFKITFYLGDKSVFVQCEVLQITFGRDLRFAVV